MDNIKLFTNDELVLLFKEKDCNLTQIERDFNLGKNAAGRLYNKRGIDCKRIKKEWLELLKADYENNPKLCKQCGKPISYEERNKKDFCSQSCAAIYNNFARGNKTRELDRRHCLNCGKELIGDKRYNKYCCYSCLSEYQYKEYIKRWKQGLETGIKGKYGISNYIRQYLFEKYNNSCLICGWGKVNPKSGKIPLQIHHIDGDCLNNREENLLLLCPNCHSLTENYGSLNQDSQRVFRKQKENL